MSASEFQRGVAHAVAGLRLIARPGLRRFVLAPLLVNVVVFGLAIVWLAGVFAGFVGTIVDAVPGWLDWLAWILWPLFALTVALTGFYTFTLVANVIGAPFNGVLAERVEDLLAPDTHRPPPAPFARELVTAPVTELGKLAWFVVLAVPFLLLFLVPVVNVVAPFTWFAFSAWTLAREYADYPMGNHRIGFWRQRPVLRRRSALVMGFGAAVLAMTLVPIVNFVAMPAAVAGATRLWVMDLAPSDHAS